MTEIDKLAWLNIKNNRLLVAKSKNKDSYYIPGGKREAGENDQEALTREIKEELSVDLISNTIQYFKTFKEQAHGKPEGVLVKLTCYLAKHTGEIKENAEIESFCWVNYQEKEKCSFATQTIINWLKNENMIS